MVHDVKRRGKLFIMIIFIIIIAVAVIVIVITVIFNICVVSSSSRHRGRSDIKWFIQRICPGITYLHYNY